MNRSPLSSRVLCGALTASLLLQSAFARAGSDCPLSNPVYKDLRSAVSVLEKKLQLGAGCEEISQKLQEAGKQVSAAARQVSDIWTPDVGTPPPQNADLEKNLSLAVSGIFDIERVFTRFGGSDNRCGRALVQRLDYVEAMIDTVNLLSPYLMVLGSAASLTVAGVPASAVVLSVNILSSAVKTFIVAYRSRSFDMSKSEQRQSFIENACGYYRVNSAIRSILQARKKEQPELEQKYRESEARVKGLERSAPPMPIVSDRVRVWDAELAEDRRYLRTFLDSVREINQPQWTCDQVKGLIEGYAQGGFPAEAVERLETLVAESESNESESTTGRPVQGRQILNYLSGINRTEFLVQKPDGCPKSEQRALAWLRAVERLLAMTDEELSRPGRRSVENTPEMQVRRAWEKDFAQAKADFEKVKASYDFIKSLSDQGSQVELSELLDSRDSIRRALFGDESRRDLVSAVSPKSPAESWLEHKLRQSVIAERKLVSNLEEWAKRTAALPSSRITVEAQGSMSRVSRQRECALLEDSVLVYATSRQHLEAAVLFCNTFDQTISARDHRRVSELCWGRWSKKGKSKKMSPFAVQWDKVLGHEVEVQVLLERMSQSSCDLPRGLNGLQKLN